MIFCLTLLVSHIAVEQLLYNTTSVHLRAFVYTQLSRLHHSISIRLRSGLWLGGCITVILFVFSQSVVLGIIFMLHYIILTRL